MDGGASSNQYVTQNCLIDHRCVPAARSALEHDTVPQVRASLLIRPRAGNAFEGTRKRRTRAGERGTERGRKKNKKTRSARVINVASIIVLLVEHTKSRENNGTARPLSCGLRSSSSRTGSGGSSLTFAGSRRDGRATFSPAVSNIVAHIVEARLNGHVSTYRIAPLRIHFEYRSSRERERSLRKRATYFHVRACMYPRAPFERVVKVVVLTYSRVRYSSPPAGGSVSCTHFPLSLLPSPLPPTSAPDLSRTPEHLRIPKIAAGQHERPRQTASFARSRRVISNTR